MCSLQGYETDLTSLVQESSAKLSEEVLHVCRACGQLALATKTRIVRLEQFIHDSASSQVRKVWVNIDCIEGGFARVKAKTQAS